MAEAAIIAMVGKGKSPVNLTDKSRREAAYKTKQKNAEKKLNIEYKNALEFGIIKAPPSVKYEKIEELMFLHQFNPVLEEKLYLFSITEGFDLEKGDEIKFLLQLKSEYYFEAKVFYKSKGFVSIDYFKGKLKQ